MYHLKIIIPICFYFRKRLLCRGTFQNFGRILPLWCLSFTLVFIWDHHTSNLNFVLWKSVPLFNSFLPHLLKWKLHACYWDQPWLVFHVLGPDTRPCRNLQFSSNTTKRNLATSLRAEEQHLQSTVVWFKCLFFLFNVKICVLNFTGSSTFAKDINWSFFPFFHSFLQRKVLILQVSPLFPTLPSPHLCHCHW